MKSGSVLVIYTKNSTKTEIAFSVKKRDFKLAVHRNRIKRLLKEAFRLNQNDLKENYTLFFIHLGNKTQDFKYYNDKINTLIKRLNEINHEKISS